ncbi:hypothetical protein RBB50_009737 [Rhinocladiella similis]
MVKYTSAILASAALATTVVANEPVCKVITEVVTGDWYWVADPTWADWAATTTTTTPAKKTTTTTPVTWADWDTTTTTKKPAVVTTTVVDPTWVDWDTTTTTTTTVVDPTWLDWTTTTTTVKTTTTTYVDPTWLDWTSTSAAVTTTTTTPAPSSWGQTTTTTAVATTTTTVAPAPVATCPASNGQTLPASGSCQCEYQVNCGVHADTSSGPAFWNKGTTDSLAACLDLCDNNDKCTATIWCDDASQCGSDYHVCWQTSGLGGVAGSGFGQVSYKTSCKGGCTESYTS